MTAPPPTSAPVLASGSAPDLAPSLASLPLVRGRGLMLMGDPHVAGVPPMQRLEGYEDQVLDKVAAALDEAARRDLVPVFLGDLFHWPRDNPNSLLVRLMDLFRHCRPWVLVGNHDKYQARYTRDVSLAVLEAAGVVRPICEPGPVFVLQNELQNTLVGATPDGFPLPGEYQGDRAGVGSVVWLAHHNVAFREFGDRQYQIRELPGIDWLVNGHIHRPQPMVRAGATRWANPGNMTRLTFTRRSRDREPAAHVWTPGCEELERFVLPHLPFGQVFPDQEFPPEEAERQGHSEFLRGLERLAWRRTAGGVGLKSFLEDNLDPERPETRLVWELYEEVTGGDE